MTLSVEVLNDCCYGLDIGDEEPWRENARHTVAVDEPLERGQHLLLPAERPRAQHAVELLEGELLLLRLQEAVHLLLD
mgnify:CR=1 FL=1